METDWRKGCCFNQYNEFYMKHLSATVLLCGASILGASAQNIIVTDKDGVAHRFNADYVKEITFEKIASQGDALFSPKIPLVFFPVTCYNVPKS